MAKPGLGAPLPALTPKARRMLKKLATELNATSDRWQREQREQRKYFERCNCPRGCYFHTSYSARI